MNSLYFHPHVLVLVLSILILACETPEDAEGEALEELSAWNDENEGSSPSWIDPSVSSDNADETLGSDPWSNSSESSGNEGNADTSGMGSGEAFAGNEGGADENESGESTTEPGTSDPGGNEAGNTGSGEGTGWTCLDIYNGVMECGATYDTCAGPCTDQACVDNCYAVFTSCSENQKLQGSPQGQASFASIQQCEETHYQGCYEQGGVTYGECSGACTTEACTAGCETDATDILVVCMDQACMQSYLACGIPMDSSGGGGEGSGGSTPAANGASCSELYACEDACNGNETCGQGCFDSGTDQAQSQWTNLILCGNQQCEGYASNADEYKSCLSQACASDYGQCFGNTEVPGGGGGGGGIVAGSCGHAYTCIQDCYSSAPDEIAFYGCIDGCYAQMTPGAIATMDSLTACTDLACADPSSTLDQFYQCHQSACPGQYSACMGSGGGGGGGVNPPAGGECAGNCGGTGASGCYCDDMCAQYGDCCSDVCSACGFCG